LITFYFGCKGTKKIPTRNKILAIIIKILAKIQKILARIYFKQLLNK